MKLAKQKPAVYPSIFLQLIGMTNRLDMLDEALLRPGRLEVHIEIGLPDEAGRLQILNIHTKSMRSANRLNPDVSLQDLAARTKNFSGAEIAVIILARTLLLLRFVRCPPTNVTVVCAPLHMFATKSVLFRV